MDGSTLSPDFLTSGARGHYTRSNIEHGKFGLGGQTKNAASNTNTCLGFKAGFAKNFYYSEISLTCMFVIVCYISHHLKVTS